MEMEIAKLMAIQERTGFPFDLEAAERVKGELQQEYEATIEDVRTIIPTFPDKFANPKRNNKTKGWIAGAPFQKLVDFNPTSRRHVAWGVTLLTNASFDWERTSIDQAIEAVFPKVTPSGQPKVDEAVLQEIADRALVDENPGLNAFVLKIIRCLTLQKWLGQLSEGAMSWTKTVEADGRIHHSCTLNTVSGRQTHQGPNLGQVNSSPWARQLFIPHEGMVMVGSDLAGIEGRIMAHYLARYSDDFKKAILEGDIHQQNADRVGCSRSEAKTLLYAFCYGAGDTKLGHSLKPALCDSDKLALGKELRRKFMDAIPGMEQLIMGVRQKARMTGKLRALDGRPLYCRSEHGAFNLLCQSAGSIISKRWLLVGQKMIDDAGYVYGKDYYRCAYIHDEQQFSVRPEIVEEFKQILIDSAPPAGAYYNLRIIIEADACHGSNWAETH